MSFTPTTSTLTSTTSDLSQKVSTVFTRTLVGIAPLTALWLVASLLFDTPAYWLGQLLTLVVAP